MTHWFMTYVRTLTRTDVLEIYGPNTPMMAWLAVPGGGPRAVERPRNLDRCVDRRLRQRAVDRLGVRSSAAWFVGDHPEFDVRGAAEAGLTAVWVRSWAEAAPEATHTISALGELLPLLFAE